MAPATKLKRQSRSSLNKAHVSFISILVILILFVFMNIFYVDKKLIHYLIYDIKSDDDKADGQKHKHEQNEHNKQNQKELIDDGSSFRVTTNKESYDHSNMIDHTTDYNNDQLLTTSLSSKRYNNIVCSH